MYGDLHNSFVYYKSAGVRHVNAIVWMAVKVKAIFLGKVTGEHFHC